MTGEEKQKRDSELLAWVAQIIRKAQDNHDFCSINIKINAGCITHVLHEVVHKFPESKQ